MTDKEATPPPTSKIIEGSSSPVTPRQCTRMTSPDTTGKTKGALAGTKEPEQAQTAKGDAPVEAADTEDVGEDNELEADDGYTDSGIGSDYSDTTSIASSVFRGIIENGRKYQVLREGEYWGPSDEKQFESLHAAHIVYTLLDSNQKNPFFRSPIPKTAQHILDVGTGQGEWCRQVADMFPSVFVQGVDLAPPPDPFVPPNCKFEVDDVLKPWFYQNRFDLIHMRDMLGAFTDEQWRLLYKQAYNNLLPGGWIEQAETHFGYSSDDGSVKPDSVLAQWGEICVRAWNRMGKNLNTIQSCRAGIEAAGFTDIQEKWYKAPIGDWAKRPLMKEVGKYCKRQLMEGLEGYIMFVLTKFGEPEPWSPEEAQVFLAKVRKEMADPKVHGYVLKRRVWGRKPLHEGQAA